MRQLKIDLPALINAFDSGSPDLNWFLDLETGEVILVTQEIFDGLEDVHTELERRGIAQPADFAAAIADFPEADWLKQSLIEAERVSKGHGTRFIKVPSIESHAAYADMADFVETVAAANIRDQLIIALDGEGAFRRFKNVIAQYPAEQKRWLTFKDTRRRAAALDWLKTQGIELL